MNLITLCNCFSCCNFFITLSISFFLYHSLIRSFFFLCCTVSAHVEPHASGYWSTCIISKPKSGPKPANERETIIHTAWPISGLEFAPKNVTLCAEACSREYFAQAFEFHISQDCLLRIRSFSFLFAFQFPRSPTSVWSSTLFLSSTQALV